MARFNSLWELKNTWPLLLILAASLTCNTPQASAITASIGQPYRGSLQNGIPFPSQFEGYTLRETDRTYTTPEVIGALLDAIEAVQQEFPGTCNLYVGDFSNPGGGPMTRHRSHQNGRDVDLGFYAKGNRPLNSFIPMNAENLDVARTWSLLENLLQSQRVQYIFVDRSLQQLFQDYALSQGADPAYLERLFARNGIIRHIPNHVDHIHVRFFAPWSTMAARLSSSDDHKRRVVEMAQQAYLPKRVNYYVKGTERNLQTLAKSFGVSTRDLCRWNNIGTHEILSPGTCLAFYKRGFEIEPVHLAQSLRPDSIPEAPAPRLASLRPTRTLSDAPPALTGSSSRSRKAPEPRVQNYTVRRGDTLYSIARANGMDVKTLREINGMKEKSVLRAGMKIKVARTEPTSEPRTVPVSRAAREPAPEVRKHKVAQGETLNSISRKYGISLAELAQINSLKDKCALRAGQELIVSPAPAGSKKTTSLQGTAARTAVKSPGNQTPPQSPAKTVSKTTPTQRTSNAKPPTTGVSSQPKNSSAKVEKPVAKPAVQSAGPKSGSPAGSKSSVTNSKPGSPGQGKTSSKSTAAGKSKS